MSLVEDLLGELDQLWPTCSGSDNSTQFWGHEWSKHGTCSGLPVHGYFETALALATKYRSQCTSGGTCGVCFEKDLKTVMPCSSSLLKFCTHHELSTHRSCKPTYIFHRTTYTIFRVQYPATYITQNKFSTYF